mgnify:CR=1 FL=1
MDKPYAITLDVGSSLANKTGAWRTNRPLYVGSPAPVQPRLPGRRKHPGMAVSRRVRRLRSGVASADRRQSAGRRHGARLLSPVRDLVQPRQARRDGGHQLGRALSRRRSDQARLEVLSAQSRERQARAHRRRRTIGIVRGVSPPAPRPRRQDRRRGSARRRHDALRHPEIPAAARRARCRDPADPRSGRRAGAQLQGLEYPRHR